MMKVLFIHGLASSGAYKTANTLRTLLRPCTVISPDVPPEPQEALRMLQDICRKEEPDLIVGLSLGGFWAQKLRGYRKVLINPDFHVDRLMRTMVGEVKYLSPRLDGAESFTVTEEMCDGYQAIAETQFEGLDEAETALTDGFFADGDELVHCGDEFALHYPGKAHHYPGKHLPTFPEIKFHIIPALNLGNK